MKFGTNKRLRQWASIQSQSTPPQASLLAHHLFQKPLPPSGAKCGAGYFGIMR
jgi:hypothetical protein